MNSIRICRAKGVKLGFGTDLLGDSFDQQSREFLIRAEVESPREIIRSATKINAQILQREGDLGVIAEGATADILALDGNPLDDLTVLTNGQGQHIPVIMKAGRLYKNELDQG